MKIKPRIGRSLNERFSNLGVSASGPGEDAFVFRIEPGMHLACATEDCTNTMIGPPDGAEVRFPAEYSDSGVAFSSTLGPPYGFRLTFREGELVRVACPVHAQIHRQAEANGDGWSPWSYRAQERASGG